MCGHIIVAVLVVVEVVSVVEDAVVVVVVIASVIVDILLFVELGTVSCHQIRRTGGVANNSGMNEMQILIKFIFRSDLTRTKQRVSLFLS